MKNGNSVFSGVWLSAPAAVAVWAYTALVLFVWFLSRLAPEQDVYIRIG